MKKHMQFFLKKTNISIIMILLSSVVGNAKEGESQETGFSCYQNGQEIFRSESSDISAFDAQSRGLQQVSAQDVPEKGVRVYIFEPGMVICSVKTN